MTVGPAVRLGGDCATSRWDSRHSVLAEDGDGARPVDGRIDVVGVMPLGHHPDATAAAVGGPVDMLGLPVR